MSRSQSNSDHCRCRYHLDDSTDEIGLVPIHASGDSEHRSTGMRNENGRLRTDHSWQQTCRRRKIDIRFSSSTLNNE